MNLIDFPASGKSTAVVVVGSNPFVNGREAHDRTTTALSESQHRLVAAVLAANPRTTVVLQTSYPDSIIWEQRGVLESSWHDLFAGSVEVRLGSPTGRLLGTATVASTGDRYAYATATARLDRVRGRHDVYLVLGAGVRLAGFRAAG